MIKLRHAVILLLDLFDLRRVNLLWIEAGELLRIRLDVSDKLN